ncbi:MAG TPA: glycosyltransferase family 2 protein [Candidatus Sulfotelmatobacter sp.]|nr:glycosyltransferase family 2 protein [Candidatus Sulfotelmatobacter sp.]
MKALFWGAAAVIMYTYAGYVGWLWLRARVRPRPVLRAAYEPQVSIVMVVRNEEAVLARKLDNLLAFEYPPERFDVVVVSDGSSDKTEEILREYARNPRVQIVLKQISMGKASGLNDAMSLASGELILFVDARQQIEPGALRTLAQNFADPAVGCVSGALILGDPASGEPGKGMGLYWAIEKKIRELESASGSVVGATGAIYAVRRELLTPVPEGTILDDVYIPMEVVRQGKRVIFEQKARAWDRPNLGGQREFSRKVRTLTGNYQLVQLAPWLLSGRNPLRFEFISHKLFRLAVPFALAILLLASILVSGPFYRLVLLLQVLFYSLSLLAGLRLSRGPLARISDAALTFVVLNSAAALAFVNFLTGRKTVWAR